MKIDKKILEKVKFFEGLESEALSQLVSDSRVISLKRNVQLFNEGDEGITFYFLISGAIKLFKANREGKEVVIKVVKPQEVFAEIILFESNRYPVNSLAIEKSEVLAIKRDSFYKLLDNPIVRDRFIGALMMRMRYLTKRVLYLTSYDIEERFIRFLIERYGEREEYIIDISKKEIATTIGTIPETLSRLIQNLTKANLISWEKNSLKVEEELLERYLV